MHQIVREEIPIWSYVFHSGNQGKFFSHSPNYGLTLKDITDATKLIEELECVLRTYGMMKS